MMKVEREEGQFPITIKFANVRKQSLTVKAAIELRNKLDKVIEAQTDPVAKLQCSDGLCLPVRKERCGL